MSTYLLIHGAMHGGWCWERVVRLLEAAGHRALAPDLPGHGADLTPRHTVTMRDYIATVEHSIRSAGDRVVLVGHSMGGVIVTAAAAACPALVEHLIYIAAVVPRDGESVYQASGGPDMRNVALESGLTAVAHDASHAMSARIAKAAFYNDVIPEDAERACSRLTPEPDAPLGEPIEVDPGKLESLRRTYILCECDRALTGPQQRYAISRYPDTRVFRLDSGHSPFLSQPEQLVDLLIGVCGAC